MRTVLTLTALAACAAVLSSCRKHDWDTQTIGVPEMINDRCVAVVSKAANGEINRCRAGHPEKSTHVDLGARTITVTYDSLKMARKNVAFAIANAGFTTTEQDGKIEVPANKKAAAKLPPECRGETATPDPAATTSAAPAAAKGEAVGAAPK